MHNHPHPSTLKADGQALPGFAEPKLLKQLIRAAKPGLLSYRLIFGALIFLFALPFVWKDASSFVRRRQWCAEKAEQYKTPVEFCRWRNAKRLKTEDKLQQACAPAAEAESTFAYCGGDSYRAEIRWSLPGLALGFLILLSWLTSQLRTPAFIRVLREQPGKVAWLYISEVGVSYSSGGHVSRVNECLWLGLVNGKQVPIKVPSSVFFDSTERKAGHIMRLFAPYVPRATLGFSERNRKQFFKDPRAMQSPSRHSAEHGGIIVR